MRCRNITSQAKQRYSSGYARIAKNADFFNEVNASALGKIGTNYVLETIKKEYLNGDFHFKLYSTGIFENIKTPESEAVVLDILPKEKDITLKTMLANGLCRLLSVKGIPLVINLMKRGYDETVVNLEEPLYINCVINGIEKPEMPKWKENMEKEQQRLREARQKFSETLIQNN